MQFKLLLAVVTLIFVSLVDASAEVELHLAFTAQESSAVLKTLAKNNPTKTIVVVSNRDVGGDQIFGHDRSYYTSSAPSQAAVANDIQANLDKANVSSAHSADMTAFLNPSAKAMTSGAANLSVMTLNTESTPRKDSDDVIVVLESPELGQQSTLLREYLKKVLPAIASLPESASAKGGIHLATFGTAGGIPLTGGAGDISSVKASLFVGTEVVPGSSPKKYQGVISYTSSEDPKSSTVLYTSPALDNPNDAQAEATNAFIALSQPGPCKFADSLQTLQNSVFDTYKNLIAKSDTSLTVSFFAGADMKQAAARLNLTNVNMEDYHVIKAVNYVQANGVHFASLNLKRVVTDPPAVSGAAMSSLTAWLKNASYSKSDYEDAILWGLKGRDLDHPPSSAKWKAFDSLLPAEAKKLVSNISFPNGSGALDPFYYGVSGNFLDQIGNPQFISSLVSESNPAVTIDSVALAKKAKTLSTLAQSVRDGANLPEDQERARIDLLLDNAKDLQTGASSTALLGSDAGYKIPAFVDDTLQLSGTTTKSVLAGPLDAKSMDRILYRHSLIALEQSSGAIATLDNESSMQTAEAAAIAGGK